MSIQGAVNNIFGGTERAVGVYKYFQNAEYDSLLQAARTTESNAGKQAQFAESLGNEEKNKSKEVGETIKEGENLVNEMTNRQNEVQEKLMDTIANKGAPRGANGKFANRQQTIDNLTAERDSLQGNISAARDVLDLARKKQALLNARADVFMNRADIASKAQLALQVNREGLEAARSGSIFARAKVLKGTASELEKFNADIHKQDEILRKEYFKQRGVK